MNYAIDSSLALSWCFEDEFSEVSNAAYRIALRSVLAVPPLWHVQVANVLGFALRRGRIRSDSLTSGLLALRRLEIETIDIPKSRNVQPLMDSMRLHGLTAYDSLYIELAQQLHLPLATFDRQMARAAKTAGISLILEPQ